MADSLNDKPSQSPYSLGYNELAERVEELQREVARLTPSHATSAGIDYGEANIHTKALYDLCRSFGWSPISSKPPVAYIMERLTPSAKATVGVDLASGPDSWACSCGASTSSPKCRDPHFNCPTER